MSKDAWIDHTTINIGEILKDVSFDQIWNLHPENYGQVRIQGRVINTPRWQQTYGKSYSYTGMNHEALEIPDELQPLINYVNSFDYTDDCKKFNQMLINWYENGHHYIGAHSDDTKQLVKNSSIVSITLGAERVFRLKKI